MSLEFIHSHAMWINLSEMIGCGCELFKQITVIYQDTCFSMLRRAVSLINYDPNQIICSSCFICATISKDLQSHMMMDTILITSLPPALNLDSKLQSRGNIQRILELIIKIESRHIIGSYCICNVYSHHLLLH